MKARCWATRSLPSHFRIVINNSKQSNISPVIFAGAVPDAAAIVLTYGRGCSTTEYSGQPDCFRAWGELQNMNYSPHRFKTHSGDQWDAE
jgi:hypothetical protein